MPCLQLSGFSLQVRTPSLSIVCFNPQTSQDTLTKTSGCESVTLVEEYCEVSSPSCSFWTFHRRLHVSLPHTPESRCNVLYPRDSFVICILEGLMLTFPFFVKSQRIIACVETTTRMLSLDDAGCWIHSLKGTIRLLRVLSSTTKQLWGLTLCSGSLAIHGIQFFLPPTLKGPALLSSSQRGTFIGLFWSGNMQNGITFFEWTLTLFVF
jgi:hypothetical protein